MQSSTALVLGNAADSVFYAIKDKSIYDYLMYYKIRSYTNENIDNYQLQYLYADSAIALIKQHSLEKKLPEELAKFLARRGEANFKLKNYTDSYDDLYNAIQMAKKYSDNCGIMYMYYSVGMILYKQQQYESSSDYFKESLQYLDNCSEDEIGIVYRKQEILDNIGLCYYKVANYDSALYYFKTASNYLDSNKNKLAKHEVTNRRRYYTCKAVILGNLAKIYVQSNQLDSAVSIYKQALSYHQAEGFDFRDGLGVGT
ncbi:MAG: hypothetical protein ACOVNY_07190 [Chitinophagaceae bacterium]